tara:strand:+ start:552 stop:1451 length:900 start_codon:yes stop_codon:yes gene_type:complete
MEKLLFPQNPSCFRYEDSIKFCYEILRNNYENFPLRFFFIDDKLMDDLASIYAFCRGVDFLGDEAKGNRLEKLKLWEKELSMLLTEKTRIPIFIALKKTIIKHNLDMLPFKKLIKANILDQSKKLYANISEVMDYCKYSANPVGEIVLNILGYKSKKNINLSNKICSALQITNFLQDIKKDKKKGRVYLPLDIMKKHSIEIDAFEEKYVFDNKRYKNFDNFLKEMVLYNRTLYDDGEKLVNNLKKRQAILIQVFVDSGRKILDKIERNKHKILVDRPKTNKLEKNFIIAKAIVKISILR